MLRIIRDTLIKEAQHKQRAPGEKTWLVNSRHRDVEGNVALETDEKELYQRVSYMISAYMDDVIAAANNLLPDWAQFPTKDFVNFAKRCREGISFDEYLSQYSKRILAIRIKQLEAAKGELVSPQDAATGPKDWRDYFRRVKQGVVSKNMVEFKYWFACAQMDALNLFLSKSEYEKDKIVEDAMYYMVHKDDDKKKAMEAFSNMLGKMKDSEQVITE